MRKEQPFWPNAYGFSLFELLVVLVIASLVFGLSGPLLEKSLSKFEGKAAARRIMATLKYARSEAIERSGSTPISFDRERRSYQLEGSERIVFLPEGWSFHELKAIPGNSPEEATVIFYSDGSSSGGEIEIGGKGKLFRIMVDPLLGDVRAQER